MCGNTGPRWEGGGGGREGGRREGGREEEGGRWDRRSDTRRGVKIGMDMQSLVNTFTVYINSMKLSGAWNCFELILPQSLLGGTGAGASKLGEREEGEWCNLGSLPCRFIP